MAEFTQAAASPDITS